MHLYPPELPVKQERLRCVRLRREGEHPPPRATATRWVRDPAELAAGSTGTSRRSSFGHLSCRCNTITTAGAEPARQWPGIAGTAALQVDGRETLQTGGQRLRAARASLRHTGPGAPRLPIGSHGGRTCRPCARPSPVPYCIFGTRI